MTRDDLQAAAERLLDALDAYDRFVDGCLDESATMQSGVREYFTDSDVIDFVADRSPEEVLADAIVDLYYEAREAEGAYVQQAREWGRSDWTTVVAETEPVREAARRVHTAGYGIDSKTGQKDYLLPKELCPARRVSMNDGSSPITYDDRVAQYRAVADQFDLSPEVVYHPGSGHDVSPSAAFPESRVVYVDVDEAAMDDLTDAGYEAVSADATGYELTDGADVIVFRNAGLVEEAVVAANLRRGGWVLANDHLESARHLARLDSLDLVGVVPNDWSGESLSVDTADLDGYLSATEGTDDSLSSPPLAKGTPLDLYVFRDTECPNST
ncbi:MAG: hypothetical protein ABEJ94_11515 [Halorientalis sp.]